VIDQRRRGSGPGILYSVGEVRGLRLACSGRILTAPDHVDTGRRVTDRHGRDRFADLIDVALEELIRLSDGRPAFLSSVDLAPTSMSAAAANFCADDILVNHCWQVVLPWR